MKKYINQYRTETIRGENNKKIRNVIYTGDYYKITKEKQPKNIASQNLADDTKFIIFYCPLDR